MSEHVSERRSGDETRALMQSAALRLFTERGFEGTSIKDIADAVGTTKAALYYHFASKDDIVRSLLDERRAEFADLWAWVEVQPRTPDLLSRVVLRWLESVTDARLDAMRFAMANGPAVRRIAAESEARGPWLDDITNFLAGPNPSVHEVLHVRMPFEMLAAAIAASRGTSATTTDIVSAARTAILELVHVGG